jgi:hypothetical protein
MGKIILKTSIKREEGYLYFISKEGDLYKVEMKSKNKKRSKTRILVKNLGIKKKNGCLYYFDKNGNIGETSRVIERKYKKNPNIARYFLLLLDLLHLPYL